VPEYKNRGFSVNSCISNQNVNIHRKNEKKKLILKSFFIDSSLKAFSSPIRHEKKSPKAFPLCG
jgi:hypothetical protein